MPRPRRGKVVEYDNDSDRVSSLQRSISHDDKDLKENGWCAPNRWVKNFKARLSTVRRTWQKLWVQRRKRFSGSPALNPRGVSTDMVVHQLLPAPSMTAAATAQQHCPEASLQSSTTPEELFKSHSLTVQVKGAYRLVAAKLSGLADPYCAISVGEERYRTRPLVDTLNPEWQETYTLSGASVLSAGLVVSFEVWSMDDFQPDDFLGQAELDLRQLPLFHGRPGKLACAMTLYVLKRNGKKEKGEFGELHVRLWLSRQGSEGNILSPAIMCGGQSMSPATMSLCMKHKTLPSVFHNALGTLYEEPCLMYIRVGIREVLNLVEPPDVASSSTACQAMPLGEMLQACKNDLSNGTKQCLVKKYAKFVRRGKAGREARPSGKKTVRVVAPDEGGPKRLAALSQVRMVRSQRISHMGSSELPEEEIALVSPLEDDDDATTHLTEEMVEADADSSLAYDEEDDTLSASGFLMPGFTSTGSDGPSGGGGRTSGPGDGWLTNSSNAGQTGPVYLYTQVNYGKQTHTSKMKKVESEELQSGTIKVSLDFVFAASRPLSSRPLDINIYATFDKERPGRLIGRVSRDLNELLLRSRELEEQLRGPDGLPLSRNHIDNVTCAPEYTLPLDQVMLDTPARGSLRMHIGAADADYRPFMYNVPLTREPATSERPSGLVSSPSFANAVPVVVKSWTANKPAGPSTSASTSPWRQGSPLPGSSKASTNTSPDNVKQLHPSQQLPAASRQLLQVPEEGDAPAASSQHGSPSPSALSEPRRKSSWLPVWFTAVNASAAGTSAASNQASQNSSSAHNQASSVLGFYRSSWASAWLPGFSRQAGGDSVMRRGSAPGGLAQTRDMSSARRSEPERQRPLDQPSNAKDITEASLPQQATLPPQISEAQAGQATGGSARDKVEEWLSQLRDLDSAVPGAGASPLSVKLSADGTASPPNVGRLSKGGSAGGEELASLATFGRVTQPGLGTTPWLLPELLQRPWSTVGKLPGAAVAAVASMSWALLGAATAGLPSSGRSLWRLSTGVKLSSTPSGGLLYKQSRFGREATSQQQSHNLPEQTSAGASSLASAPTLRVGMSGYKSSLSKALYLSMPDFNLLRRSATAGIKDFSRRSLEQLGSKVTHAARSSLDFMSERGSWLSQKLSGVDHIKERQQQVLAKQVEAARPIGTLHFRLEMLKLEGLPNVYYFTLIKVGPQWIKSMMRKSDDEVNFHWEMRLPIYDPSTILVAATFWQKSLTAKASDVHLFSRSVVPVAAMPPNREFTRKIVAPMLNEEGLPDSSGAKMIVQFRSKLHYPKWQDVAMSYFRPIRPPYWYTLGLDSHDRTMLDKQARKIITRWLTSCYPPVPAHAVKLVLHTHRDRFALPTLKHNLRRVRKGIDMIAGLFGGLQHIMSWKSLWSSSMAYLAVICFCFFPSATLAALFVWIMLQTWGRRHMIGQPQGVHAIEDDDDDDLDVPTTSTLSRLKRQYEQVIGIALTVQNFFDDLAAAFERIHALRWWSDPTATTIAIILVSGATVAIYLLGIQLVLAVILLYILRPPRFRDPEPVPIMAYYDRLPMFREAPPKETTNLPTENA